MPSFLRLLFVLSLAGPHAREATSLSTRREDRCPRLEGAAHPGISRTRSTRPTTKVLCISILRIGWSEGEDDADK